LFKIALLYSEVGKRIIIYNNFKMRLWFLCTISCCD